MSGMLTESLPWVPPLAAAAFFARRNEACVFLYSGQRRSDTGRYSWLAVYPQEVVKGQHWSDLEKKLARNNVACDNAWFGWLGYELLHDLENIPRETNSYITLPDMWFARFGMVFCFDHDTQTLVCYHEPNCVVPEHSSLMLSSLDLQVITPRESKLGAGDEGGYDTITSLEALMTHDDYIRIIEDTREAIRRGDFYQANITRKFVGTFHAKPDEWDIFCRLADASPSAYSAFIKTDGHAVISSSPESFLQLSPSGFMQSRPIKGTAPRFADPQQDDEALRYLAASEKERAENLMIVDLMRNDLAAGAVPGSVKVERLFEIASYRTLHHLASSISAWKKDSISTLQAVKHCFPPGSMTGAPKISAIKWCMDREKIRRGVYSGALGWFGGDGSCDLSVVIRTLVLSGNRFEFQTGGGITLDSDPEKEWQETVTKARGIMIALGIKWQG